MLCVFFWTLLVLLIGKNFSIKFFKLYPLTHLLLLFFENEKLLVFGTVLALSPVLRTLTNSFSDGTNIRIEHIFLHS